MKENNHRWSSLHVIIFSIFYYIFGQRHITPVLLRFPYINPMHYKAYVFRLYLFYTICAKKYEIAACIINVGVIRKSYQSYNASEPYSKNKGGISYIPWCITSYNIIKLLNSCDPVSSTGMRQSKNREKWCVLPIKPFVPLLCRSSGDFHFIIPNISFVKL